MTHIDEIIYEAIQSDETLMDAIGGRVVSTCFEVPPDEDDNTPVPNIIITDDGFQNQTTTKDSVWEAMEDRVQVGVDVAATSPQEVKRIVKMVRKAVERYLTAMYVSGKCIPELESLSSDGLAWDWMKPCYHQLLTYQCITLSDIDDEQEEDNDND